MTSRAIRPLLLALALGASLPALALTPSARPSPQIPAEVSNPAWAQDMVTFAEQDAAKPVPKGGILFIGSSSIRMWDTLAADFPGQTVINRGFGGSEVRDSTYYADRIVVPYAPCKVFFYAGDNDLNSGRSPTQVRDDTVAFVKRVHRDLPKTTVEVIAIKPSPSRANLLPAVKEANTLVQQALGKMPHTGFVDIYTPMLGADGQPQSKLFREDMLHMKPEGYAIWKNVIAPKVNCDGK